MKLALKAASTNRYNNASDTKSKGVAYTPKILDSVVKL